MDSVDVSIGAKLDGLISGFQSGARAVDNFFGGPLQKLQKELEETGTAADKMSKKVEDSGERVDRTGKKMEGSFSGIKDMLSVALAGFTLEKGIETVLDFSDAVEHLDNTAKIIGTTATQMSRLHAVVEPMGISAETLDKGMSKLARTMTDAARGGDENIKAFEAIGIKAEDLKNMSIEQVFAKLSDKFKDTEDGATKTALATALLGRSGADLIPVLNLGSEEMKKQGDAAQAMGAALGEDAVNAGLKLDAAWDKLTMQGVGLKNMFAQSLAPVLQYIAELFTDGSGTAMDFASVFKVVGTVVVGVVAVIREAWAIVSGIVRGITIAISSVVTAVARAASGDFAGAKASLIAGKDMIKGEMQDLISSTVDIAEKAKGAFSNIWDPKAAVAAPAVKDAPKAELDFKPKESVDAEIAAKAKAAAAAAQAAAQKEFDYKMELLKNELSALDKGSEEKLAVVHKMTEAVKVKYGEQSREYAQAQQQEVQVTKEIEAEKRRIKDAALGIAREHAETAIQLERGKADMLLATGQINAVQRVAVDQRAEEQMYALQLSYLQQRLALYATEPQERQRINDEIERLNADHLVKMQEGDLAIFQANKSQWDTYFQSITDGFANAIQGMVFQGLTLQQAMGNVLQNILGQMIQTGVKMAANWMTTQLAMTGATVTGAATRSAAEAASAKESVATNAGAAIKNILTKGAEVFANVYNAIAGIPYVGPFLAPVMAVAAGAAVVGMVGKVASAEGGWDRVPYDGAQAILHKEEMVLPAQLADGIRRLVDSDAGGARGGVTIHALDRRDVERYFNDNADLFMRTLGAGMANNPGGF